MSTINMVRCFFYRENFPKDAKVMRALVALAYQTARDRKLYPKAILIRYVIQAYVYMAKQGFAYYVLLG